MTKQDILSQCTVSGLIVSLPDIQLDRKIYQDVAKSLELIGGKWNRKERGFLFNEDPSDLLSEIASGEKRNLKKEFQFFATPSELADYLVELADIKVGNVILEPSAGQGAIINSIHKILPNNVVDYFELMSVNQTILNKIKNTNFRYDDFMYPNSLTYLNKYDRIVANPPFSKNQDIDHIKQMYDFLKSGGRLVSVASIHWKTSSNKKESKFREWLDEVGAEIIDVDAGAFKNSGTNVSTCIIVIQK